MQMVYSGFENCAPSKDDPREVTVIDPSLYAEFHLHISKNADVSTDFRFRWDTEQQKWK